MNLRLIFGFVLCSIGICYAEDIQVKMLTRSYFDVPVIGRVYLLQTTYLSNNRKNSLVIWNWACIVIMTMFAVAFVYTRIFV